ncbi:MAG: hypothetical protein Q9167_005748 [Letrouitia subvulpina]
MDSQNSVWALRLPAELQPFLLATTNSYLAGRTADDIRLIILWFNQGIYEQRINERLELRSQSFPKGTISSLISWFFPLQGRVTPERELEHQPSNEESESTAAISVLEEEEKEFSARVKSPCWLEEFDRPSLRKISHPKNGRSNWISDLLRVRKDDLKSVRAYLIHYMEDGQPEYLRLKTKKIPRDAEAISGPRKEELRCLLQEQSRSE